MEDHSSLVERIRRAREEDPHRTFSYLSRVSTKFKYVCVVVPKVAGTNMKLVLNQLDGGAEPDQVGAIHEQGTRLSDFSVEENVEMLTSPEWFRFTFVRNPYDRLLSAYKSKVGIWGSEYEWLQDEIKAEYDYPVHPQGWKAIPAFRDFVRYLIANWSRLGRDGHFNSQSNILMPDVIHYDLIKWYWFYVEEFRKVLERFGAPPEVVARVAVRYNVTLPIHHPVAYDRELADSVYELYREDFDRFGFDRHSWLYDSDSPGTTSHLSGVLEGLADAPVADPA